jgi:hypothetical protein
MKKNICFLFTGQTRTSPFSINFSALDKVSGGGQDILESYEKYIFTTKFKKKYDYKIFISTDDIHLNNTINYFSEEKIGNIHLLNTDFYLNDIETNINNISYYLDIYDKNDFGDYCRYNNSIYQHYKILDGYNLIRNYKDFGNFDYIIRLRLDIALKTDLCEAIKLFEKKQNLEIILGWDYIAIGKPKIMEWYCTGLENNYGNYNYKVKVPDKLPVMSDYNTVPKSKWAYSPERQLFEMLFEYCNNNNLDINKSILSYLSIEIKR